ncbi:hypothetical protein [Saccharothrix algeriensis]|uniref:Uncharacterized protein n=1 Tax=Saccharothrix algeriensis TaxID=173560 RepID=A0ABS2S714_9PSEU|nr:hypothetical protein [Saccharothrix algeriensis]MBM7811073.1 hypothetical protein [Saccharothrix algeriensis]
MTDERRAARPGGPLTAERSDPLPPGPDGVVRRGLPRPATHDA